MNIEQEINFLRSLKLNKHNKNRCPSCLSNNINETEKEHRFDIGQEHSAKAYNLYCDGMKVFYCGNCDHYSSMYGGELCIV